MNWSAAGADLVRVVARAPGREQRVARAARPGQRGAGSATGVAGVGEPPPAAATRRRAHAQRRRRRQRLVTWGRVSSSVRLVDCGFRRVSARVAPGRHRPHQTSKYDWTGGAGNGRMKPANLYGFAAHQRTDQVPRLRKQTDEGAEAMRPIVFLTTFFLFSFILVLAARVSGD